MHNFSCLSIFTDILIPKSNFLFYLERVTHLIYVEFTIFQPCTRKGHFNREPCPTLWWGEVVEECAPGHRQPGRAKPRCNKASLQSQLVHAQWRTERGVVVMAHPLKKEKFLFYFSSGHTGCLRNYRKFILQLRTSVFGRLRDLQ